MDPQKTEQEDTISLLDIFAVLAKYWKSIFFTTVFAGVVIVVLSIISLKLPPEKSFLPNEYTPKVIVRLADKPQDSLSSMLQSSDLGILSGLAGVSGGSTNADLAQSLILGNTLVDKITEQYDFINRYGISEHPKTSSRKIFKESISADYEGSTGFLTISYTDIDKELATNIVNTVLDELEIRFKELTMEEIYTTKTFLEERLAEVEQDLQKAQDDLIEFQQKYGIFDLEIQGEMLLTEISQLTSEITALELKYDEEVKAYYEGHPTPATTKKEIERKKALLDAKRQGLESTSGSFVSGVNSLAESQLPEIAVRYANLEAELKIHTSIKSMLRSQYESKKIEEADNSKSFQIIERAEIPEIKSGPSRGKLCMIVTVAAFFLVVFTAFIREYLSRIRKDPEESEKLRQIRGYFSFRKKK